TPGFPRTLLQSGSGLHETQGENILLTRSEATIAGHPFNVALATRIAPPAPEVVLSRPMKAAFAMAYIILGIILYNTVFRAGALAKTLFGQLLTGFLFAAILPFSAILAGTARFAAVDLETRIRSEKLDLVQVLDEIDRRHLLHHPFIWDRIERLSSLPRFQQAVRRSQAMTPTASAAASVDPSLPRLLNCFRQNSRKGTVPYFLYQVILAGPGDWKYEMSSQSQDHQATSMFTFYVCGIAWQMFNTIGDMPGRGRSDASLGDAVKREMAVETGFAIFRSVFKPELSYHTLYSPLTHVLFPGGNGLMGMSNILLPDATRPRSFISWISNGTDAEITALRRIIQGMPTRFALFGCQLQYCSAMIKPALGGAIPDIAGIARWTQARNIPMSTHIGSGSTALIVETRPGVFNPRVFFAGAAAEAPLKAATAHVENSLLLWLAAGCANPAALRAPQGELQQELDDARKKLFQEWPEQTPVGIAFYVT
ncbi:MAG TPA: hypothetical protein PKM25_18175, partial [Candidatus Ozemobacteraceae bacterium]|nr:hypothetical protein [Candidatus Ozemobacteraceae bacterium]